jgi:ATP-dependent RNA helicase DeaD
MGMRSASLTGPFALPGHADIVVGTPRELRVALERSDVSLLGLQALVVSGAAAILAETLEAQALEALLQGAIGEDVQRVVVTDPVTATVRTLVEAHLKRAVFIPTDAGHGAEAPEAPVQRGTLKVRLGHGEEIIALATLASELLEAGPNHLLLFFRSEDRAADLGDLLTLHGFTAGAPGDLSLPIWLATDAQAVQEELRASGIDVNAVLPVSVDVPSDPDTLDQRHHGRGGVIFAASEEMAHLRRISAEAGYVLEQVQPTPATDAGMALRIQVAQVLEEQDLEPYHLLLEEAWTAFTPQEVGAALAFLLRRKETSARPSSGRSGGVMTQAGASETKEASEEGGMPKPFVRLFLSVGSKDGIRPGELLGAITGEAGIQGGQVGRIELKDTFSRVEVESGVAERVIRALNGTTIRGRSVRADYDRGAGRAERESGPRPGGPARRGGGAPSRGGGGPSRGGGAPGRGPRRSP